MGFGGSRLKLCWMDGGWVAVMVMVEVGLLDSRVIDCLIVYLIDLSIKLNFFLNLIKLFSSFKSMDIIQL